MPHTYAACGGGWPVVFVQKAALDPERPAVLTLICRHCWNPIPGADQQIADAPSERHCGRASRWGSTG
jgi:hypothetical protein